MALGALDAPNAALGAWDAPNAALGASRSVKGSLRESRSVKEPFTDRWLVVRGTLGESGFVRVALTDFGGWVSQALASRSRWWCSSSARNDACAVLP
ncbi:hypothetical protein DMP23_06410 [Amycolatopsis sp. A1MSW2902]